MDANDCFIQGENNEFCLPHDLKPVACKLQLDDGKYDCDITCRRKKLFSFAHIYLSFYPTQWFLIFKYIQSTLNHFDWTRKSK